MRNHLLLLLGSLLLAAGLRSQSFSLQSPNKKITVSLYGPQAASSGQWYLATSYTNQTRSSTVIPRIDLGLTRSDQDFSKELKLVKTSKPVPVHDEYTVLHGKKSLCVNDAFEVKLSFENAGRAKMNVILRAYNDGLVFRYEFPESGGTFVVQDEATAYTIPKETNRWLERWNPANEGLYAMTNEDKVQQQESCYPALFQLKDTACWYLIHEADLDRGYCGTKLSNQADVSRYKLTFPNPRDGRGMGESAPTITLPWKSPWRVVVMGSLADIVSSTLVDDVSALSVVKNTAWVKPGLVSWNYWSSNHGTKDYKIVTQFADLAAEMNWPYTLLDWEWDGMTNGGNVADAAKYILSKGVKPLIWYNSGGNHTYVASTPKDRMLTHENRVAEFTKLREMGFAGVKIDFFESEKQDMIRYYLDILEDAAAFEMMVYFHGCLVPRGWARTYPNLMTYEAVRGAEWYNNGPDFTITAAEHNSTLPFTRNVVGAMDYTPVTFTNSQFPHLTSFGHELALAVLFESGLQHLADRPEGYHALPDAAKNFLRELPNAWDDTRLLDGYPGRDIILARRKNKAWYLAGVNGETREKSRKVKLDFLADSVQYKMTLITDGRFDQELVARYMLVNKSTTIDLRLLRRGGFTASIIPLP